MQPKKCTDHHKTWSLLRIAHEGLLQELMVPYLEALQNFRSGLRSGDMEKITSAKAIFAPLFHARHHPHYQEIEMVEAVQRQSVPPRSEAFL